jgi:ABC-2 type transport system permease protein
MNTKKLLTQVKRELWENKIRFVYAPIIVTALLLGIMSIGVVKLGMSFAERGVQFNGGATIGHGSSNEDRVDLPSMLAKIDADGSNIYDMIVSGVTYANTSILGFMFLFVLLAYALGCLFDDRKNKDILFWRSLPVSETTNVLVKLGFLLLYSPLIIFVLNLIMGVIALVTATAFFSYHGAPISGLFSSIIHSGVALTAVEIFLRSVFFLILLLPVIGFMLLSSAWAKKSPFLFFLVLPVGLLILDKIFQEWFGANLHVIDTFIAYGKVLVNAGQGLSPSHLGSSHPAINFNANLIQGLLISTAVGVAFVTGSIWLRNNRYEI